MSDTFDRPLILIGGGGHACVLLDLLDLLGAEVLGVTTANGERHGRLPQSVQVLGDDSALCAYSPSSVMLVNALGATTASVHRKEVQQKFRALGYVFPTLVHPAACVSSRALLHVSCQIMAGAVVQAGALIGEGAIINTTASVDHDCDIGCYAHIAPGATLSGEVLIGECSLVGTGASIIQGVRVGAHSTVGAGSAVIRNVADHAIVAGTPARPIH